MLVLTRGHQQDILIGNDIWVRVLKIEGNNVSLGIHAPKNIQVHRREVADRILKEKTAYLESQIEKYTDKNCNEETEGLEPNEES